MVKTEKILNFLFLLGAIAFVAGIIGEFTTLHEAHLILTVLGALLCLGASWLAILEEKGDKETGSGNEKIFKHTFLLIF